MTENEVEAICRIWYGRKWDGPIKDAPGPKMKDVWRKFARQALEAIDNVRKTC